MARKRHLASTARGFCGFCLMTLVTTGLLRSIRIIRGRKESISSGVLPSRQRFGSRALIRGRCPRLLKVVPSRHQSARGVLVMRLPSRHQSARGVLVMRLPSRHRSACGVLVMRLPILIGHDVTHSALLPGGQYTRGWGRSLSTRRRISLWLQGSLFCTANGSYFVLWLSVCQRQTRRAGRFSQASLLAWMNITT